MATIAAQHAAPNHNPSEDLPISDLVRVMLPIRNGQSVRNVNEESEKCNDAVEYHDRE